ncbi:MAG TPA: class I SAM-dependent methyltransferase [Burkholderiaceae bacterium]
MKLLVTTSQSLLQVDTVSDEIIPLDRGRGLYYGIAHAEGKLYVAARMRAVSATVEAAEERGEILIFDRNLKPCGTLQAPFPLRDLHEIAWHQGKLYASCSHDNMIAIHDGKAWEQWFPLGGSMEGPGDVNHFNSFFFEDERIWVLAHNRGDSELLAFSLASRELLERIPMGIMAHNIWRDGDELLTCSSLVGKVIGTKGFLLETGEFPRGIAIADNFRCVGISAMAERKERDFTTGRLAIYDGSWQKEKEIVLHDEGLVLDLHILPPGFSIAQESTTGDATIAADSFYRAYEDRNRGSRALIKSRLLVYRAFYEPWIKHEQRPQAIDLGCGRGEWLELLRDAGFASSGVDLDEGMLAGLRQIGLDARRADALQALRSIPDASMAIVSAFHVVEHIPFDDVRTLISEAMRVLKPGGLLILETPNPENLVVGSSLFYQDPTHLRPLPPELLRFAVEHAGFERHIVARLQEDASLHGEREIGLWSVLEGASPDYAVIGQKKSDAEFMDAFNPAFDAGYGILLPALAHRYEMQERRRASEMFARTDARTDQHFRDLRYNLDKAEERIAQLEERLTHLHNLLNTVFANPTWKLSAPLRWIATQVRLARQMGLASRLRMAQTKLVRPVVRKAVNFVDNRATLRQVFVNAIKVVGLYGVLRSFYSRLSRTQSMVPVRKLDPTVSDMSERSAAIYKELKSAAAPRKEPK